MSASLGSVLSEVSNETIVVNDVVTLDLERKWVLYVEENATAESAVGFQKVPRDFNIFVLLNISSYSQDIEGWQVVLEKDSRKYEVFNSLFQSVNNVYYHMYLSPVLYYSLLAAYLPVMVLGAIFNLTIITVVLTNAKLRSDPRNCFIVALAFSDFKLCVFASPLTLWYTLESHWPLGGNTLYLCKLVKAGQDFPIFMSSFCIGAIACDRFMFIMYPHKKQMSAKQGFIFSSLLAMASSVFVSPVFVKSRMWHFPVLKTTFFCGVQWEGGSRGWYTLVSCGFHFFLTFVIVAILYLLIYLKLKNRHVCAH